MTAEQEQALTEKLAHLGYTGEVVPGGEALDHRPMLHVQGHLICSVEYALIMDDEQLSALVAETVGVPS